MVCRKGSVGRRVEEPAAHEVRDKRFCAHWFRTQRQQQTPKRIQRRQDQVAEPDLAQHRTH